MTNQFGKRLFNIFFKTYTEKVWGMSCKEISADWAAQRIKGLSLKTAILNALLPKKKPRSRDQVIKTLIDTFRYPRKGPGMMWEACAARVRAMGGSIEMGAKRGRLRVRCRHGAVDRDARGAQKDRRELQAQHVISSAPMRQLAHGLTPRLSDNALHAATR